jgi:type I restriction enzyme, S subunit
MTKQMSVPKLRFPEFSGNWELKRLGEVYIEVIDGDRGSNYPNGDDFSKEGYCLFLNAKNVTKNGFSFSETMFISKEKDNKLRKGKLTRYDIVLTTRGSVGHIAFYNSGISFENLRINSGMVIIRGDQNYLNLDYLYKYLNSNQIQNEILKVAFGSAQPQLTVSEIVKLKIQYPPLPEQTKIANFLTAIDEKIQGLKEKKSLLEEYKKGLMQQIFSQKLRFKQDDGTDFPDWEEKTLGEVLDYEQPTKYIVSSTEYNENYTIPVLTAGKTFVLGYTNEKFGVFENDLPVIIFDDFTTANKFVNFPFKVKSSAMKILLSKEGTNIKFVYEVIQSLNYLIGGHERHWISKYSLLEIPFPSSGEQEKIANFLTSIDEKIEKVSQQIGEAETYKNGLLQQMFV